jgi:hypothetical protein
MLGGTVWAARYFIAQHPPGWRSVLAASWAAAASALGVAARLLAHRDSPYFLRVYPALVPTAPALEAWGGRPWATVIPWVTTASAARRPSRITSRYPELSP